MWEWRLQFVFLAQTRTNLNLWTQDQRILVKNEVERAASSCRKRRRQRGEGGALPWKLSGARWVLSECWFLVHCCCFLSLWFFLCILSNVMLWLDDQYREPMNNRKEINWLVSASTTISYVPKRKESKTQAMDLVFFSGRRFPSTFEIFISTLFVPPLWTGTFHFTPWKCIWNIWTLKEQENTKCNALLTGYSRELTSH